MSHSIEVKNLSKSFGQKKVIDNISFTLPEEESMVMLGLNGAGKTTTISMLLGLLKPTQGDISVLQQAPGAASTKPLISCLPQASTFPSQLKVKEVLQFMRSHYDSINPNIVDIFNLEELLSSPLKNLSGGQKRRVSLACAFIGQPKLVFLDEPTAGVDISQKKLIWNYLLEFQKSGGSLFLTTHDLMEAEVLSQNLLFLHRGKIVEKGTREDLKRKFSLKKIKFKAQVKNISLHNESYEPNQNDIFEISVTDDIETLKSLLGNYGDKIQDLTVTEMSLMEVVDHIEEQR